MPTTTIRAYVEGKLRRAELSPVLSAEPLERADPQLGPGEVQLSGPGGSISLFSRGLLTAEGHRVPYADLVSATALEDGLMLEPRAGPPLRLRTSPEGARVLEATLRWIGSTEGRRSR